MRRMEDRFIPVMRSNVVMGFISGLALVILGVFCGSSVAIIIGIATLCIDIPANILLVEAPDQLRSASTERTLRVASTTLDQVATGLTSENCQAVCQVLLPETDAIAVALTDTENVLGYVGEKSFQFSSGVPIRTQATKEVIKNGKMQTFNEIMEPDAFKDFSDTYANDLKFIPAGIIVPLKVKDDVVGTLKFYYRTRQDINRTQLAIAWGYGQVLSMELSSHELDKQAELTARAEVKALQAQINPHFLFNTLNTIAAFTRTDPAKARTLLREFAVFYRQTLENSESKIAVTKELEQTRRYLVFEHARFGEDRIVETEHVQPGCEDVPVPAFVIQPIVENAVRHAMRDTGPLNIDIHVATEGDDVLIAVVDDGLGMSEETARNLLSSHKNPNGSTKGGCGVALHNVAERVEKFYGIGSGVEIMSKPDEGTCVTLRLANAVPKYVDNDDE